MRTKHRNSTDQILNEITSASSSFFIFSLFLSTCWHGDLRQAFFFFYFVFCYYSYVGFRNVSDFNLKHWFFVLVSWGFGVKTYDSCFWICMFVFLFIYLFILYLFNFKFKFEQTQKFDFGSITSLLPSTICNVSPLMFCNATSSSPPSVIPSAGCTSTEPPSPSLTDELNCD